MRAAAALAVALLAGGCEHMYGAVDAALTDAQAIGIARREAARRNVSLEGLQPSVGRFDTGVSVFFRDPACDAGCVDGLPKTFFIPAGQGRVTYVDEGRV